MRVAAIIEYNGHPYHGWQRQKNTQLGIQQFVEDALSKIADEPIACTCAGRTDSGVHALFQVVHFDTTKVRTPEGWLRGTNRHLPDNIKIRWVNPVNDLFSARYSATSRKYTYLINNANYQSAIMHSFSTWVKQPLDERIMHQSAQILLGSHDFTSFQATGCQSKTPIKTIHQISVKRQHNWVILEVEANAFLYHMVRNIVGSLSTVGTKLVHPEWIEELLHLKDRSKAAKTAAANGLYLSAVRYPEKLKIPQLENNILSLL